MPHMPRYHFNVYDGRSARDVEGSVLSNAGEARREGIRLAGVMLDRDASRFDDGYWWLEVTDARGSALFRLDLFASTLPTPRLCLALPASGASSP